MNKEQVQKLKIFINKIVESKVQSELKRIVPLLKKQILSEVKISSGLIAKQSEAEQYFNEQYKPVQRSKPSLNTNSSILNSIFENTVPLDDAPEPVYREPGKRLNVVTTDPDGRPIDLSNPNNQRLMEMFNKDYSDKLDEITPQSHKPKSISQSAISSIMGNTKPIEDDGLIDPLNEEW